MKIIKPAILEGYAPRKDGTVTLRFSTQEQSPAEIAEVHQMINGFGYLYFRDEETLNEMEIKELDSLDTELGRTKTQSQRIRNVLYKCWEQDPKGFSDFKNYYKHRTERLINNLKQELV